MGHLIQRLVSVMPEIQLSWQPGFSLLRKPRKRPVPRRTRQQRFEFIIEQPQRAYRPGCSPSVIPFTSSPSLSDSLRERSIIAETNTTYFQDEAGEQNGSLIIPSVGTLNDEFLIRNEGSHDLEAINSTAEPRPDSYSEDQLSPLYLSEHNPTAGEHNVIDPEPTAINPLAFTGVPSPAFTSVPRTIESNSLTERFKPILRRCMYYEFCAYIHSPRL